MANSSDLRVIKTKNLIKDSFYELLKAEDFDKINVKQICQKSMIGRSTFYQHYDDKYDLLQRENQLYVSKFTKLMSDNIDSFQDEFSLKLLVSELNDAAEQILLLLNIVTDGEDLADQFEEIIRKSIQSVVNANPMSDLPLDFIEKIYADNILSFLKWSLKNGYDEHVDSFLQQSLKQEYDLWLQY